MALFFHAPKYQCFIYSVVYNELIGKQEVEDEKMSEYSDFKHDFRMDYETGDQSRGMFHLDDLGPSFKGDPMFALRVSLALATIETELYPTLNDGVNYMFYHTYENVDRIIVGVHVESQEELDEMKRDRDFVLNSGKLDYEDAFRDE